MAEYWKSKPSVWYPPPGGKLKTYRQGRIVRADENLTPTELKIIEEFITATAADGFCNHKISKLVKMLKKTERTIKRALKGLWEKDYIRIEQRHNKSSLYMLGCKLVPKAPSNVMLATLEPTEDEQLKEWQTLVRIMSMIVPQRANEWKMYTSEELIVEREKLIQNLGQNTGQNEKRERTKNQVTEYQGVRSSWGDMGDTSRGDIFDTPDLTKNVTSSACN